MKEHAAIHFPYGRELMTWQPAPELDVTLVSKAVVRPSASPEELVAQALANPLGSPAIGELARGARTATIVVTDATRPCPDRLLVQPLLDELNDLLEEMDLGLDPDDEEEGEEPPYGGYYSKN